MPTKTTETRSAQFTREAEKALERANSNFALILRREALHEALRARGEPVEVTASDVGRAKQRLVSEESTDTMMALRWRITVRVMLLAAVVLVTLSLWPGGPFSSQVTFMALVAFAYGVIAFDILWIERRAQKRRMRIEGPYHDPYGGYRWTFTEESAERISESPDVQEGSQTGRSAH